MTKVSGSYESVVRGVSQQVPQDRLSGQHEEQVNMVSDPVHGLTRRHGSVTVAEATLPHDFDELLTNTAGHRSFYFASDGEDFDLLYRSGVREVETELDDTLFCFARNTSQFLPVVLHDTIATQALRHAGVSAMVQVGRFVVMAGNAYQTTWLEEPLWDTPENKSKLAAWVRGGAYSRTFKVILTDRLTGEKTTISYTTKSASYPELLDTTDLLTSDPDYQKKINDRVNEYNGKTTEWIGVAAADIVPANIANKLKEEYDALGLDPASVVGSTLIIEDTKWSEIAIDDDGDNSLMEAVGNVIESAEGACPVHFVGKIIKVRPSKESPENAYYLRAHAKDDVSLGVTEVTWREGCATNITPQRLFVLATVEEGTMYVSDDLDWLELQIGPGADNDIPRYSSTVVGDDLTNPLPNFLGKSIDYLGMFQDRLVVGSGPILTASRTGDYFNFFRSSVLTIKDDDPWEIFSLGSEEDVIKHSTMFNRDLILYGQRGQYVISGRVPQTSKTAAIVSVGRYEGSIDAAPQVSGNFAFYATKRGPVGAKVTSLRQFQLAALSDNPESVDVSQQLDGYIDGTCMELATATNPDTVVIRTGASRRRLYLYTYLDRADNGQRVLDAWHRWEWSPLVGRLIGIAISSDGDILAYVVRRGANGDAWLACERFTLKGSTSSLPYLDCLRPQENAGSLAGYDKDQVCVAFGATGEDNSWLGNTEAQIAANPVVSDYTGAYRGILYPSYVVPTNPFPKDQNGRTITFGRMTLGTVKASLADTGGCTIGCTRNGASSVVTDFNGFRVGSPTAQPSKQPIIAAAVQGYIGGEIRECSYSISSKRWLPLTVTALEWAGQLFNREKRRNF